MQKRKVVVATLGATILIVVSGLSTISNNSVNTKDSQIHKVKNITTFSNVVNTNKLKKIHNTKLNENTKDLNKQVKTIKVNNLKAQKQITNNIKYKWLDIPLTHNQQKWVFDLCKRNSIDPYLVFAIMKEETQFQNKMPTRYNRCMGIMQIDNITAKDTLDWLYRTDRQQYNEIINGYWLSDYFTNVHMGICTLKKLYIMYNGNDLKPLLVYGCGSGRAEQLIKKYGYFQPKFVREWFDYQWQLQTYGRIIKEL